MSKVIANLDEKVREQLRSRIATGDLGAGAHLSELKLSKEYNVSRTPIREALCALAADGLVEMVPHRGAFVRTVNENQQWDQHFVYSQMMGICARMTAENAGIETLMDLETAIGFLSTNDMTAFMKASESINELIVTTAGSETLSSVMTSVSRRMVSSPTWLSEESTEKMSSIKQEYTYLLGAMKRQKGDAAEKTMRGLMSMFGEELKSTSSEGMMPTQETSTTTEVSVN